jgi:hypothetical protein
MAAKRGRSLKRDRDEESEHRGRKPRPTAAESPSSFQSNRYSKLQPTVAMTAAVNLSEKTMLRIFGNSEAGMRKSSPPTSPFMGRATLSLFMCGFALLVASQSPASAFAEGGGKKNVLSQAALLKGEEVFWNVTNSSDFVTAEQNLDFDTMFSMLNAQGIPQNPKWAEVGLCLPPNYWVNQLTQIYGPNPNDNNIVEWYLGWMPVCTRGTRIVVQTLWDNPN